MSKRVLLTGASGFIGSHVLKRILEQTDWEVVCLSTFTHHGIQDRIAEVVQDFSRVKVIISDLASPISDITSKSIGKIDYVINVASESHVDRSIQNPTPFILNNVALICNLLDWARANPVEKFLHVSTDEVYGPYQHRANVEWDPHLPSNPYSASKAAQEDIAFAYWRTYDIPIIITNTMNVIGEMQHVEKFTPLVIKKIVNDETITIHSSNGVVGVRDWLYVGNQASALLHILSLPVSRASESSKPDRWNISGDVRYSNLEWAEIISNIIGKSFSYNIVDSSISRPGYDHQYMLNNEKLLLSGWNPPYDIDKAIEDTVKWYLNHRDWL